MYGTYGTCVCIVLFVRDAIFPHGIPKRAINMFESQKEVVKNKERPLGEIKWAMQSTWWGWTSAQSICI